MYARQVKTGTGADSWGMAAVWLLRARRYTSRSSSVRMGKISLTRLAWAGAET